MKDWSFLYNRYIRAIKKYDGLSWDFPRSNKARQLTLINHQEYFLNDLILRKGEVFVDAGANVGAWSIRASPYYSMIHSFEPNPEVYNSFKRNIKLNHCKNIKPWNVALGMQNTILPQAILFPTSPELPMRTCPVKTETLDRLNLTVLSLLKIDVEGAGSQIIMGGFRTIVDKKPVIIIEVHTQRESEIPKILPFYNWTKRYRDVPQIGDWLYREEGKQVFLIGNPEK